MIQNCYIQELDSHNAIGADSIPANLLLYKLLLFLLLYLKLLLSRVNYQMTGNFAYVTPIFKKGNRRSAVNYRPISLTSICYKVLEHILHSSIFTHLERHKELCVQQHGFRSGRSCETQLLGTVHDFATCLNNSGHIDVHVLTWLKALTKSLTSV